MTDFIPKIRLREINSDLIQPRFERAIRRRAGQGCPLSRYDLAVTLGVDVRTVDGWLNDGRMPPLPIYYRLCALFGPEFQNEIVSGNELNGVVDSRSVSLADIVALEKFHTDAAEKMRTILNPPSNVEPLKARAS